MNAKWRITFVLMLGTLTFVGTLLAKEIAPANQAQQSVAAAMLQAGVIYVDQDVPGPTHDGLSWTTAYTDVQQALTAAISGDEIWVAEGVYFPGAAGNTAATFQLKSGVALYGGFAATETQRTQRDWVAHVTVLSGDIDRNDLTDADGIVTDPVNITGTNAYHVVTGNGVTQTAVLDGFTITAGKATGSSPDSNGGGMYNSNSNPSITNVAFSGNQANFGGGMFNEYSNPALMTVTFTANQVYYSAGGMYNWYSSPTLINTIFSGNQAATGGGMTNHQSSPTLTNVRFSGNQADSGGGMRNVSGSNPRLTNATFSGNLATYYGGGMYNNYSNPTLVNCILWGNSLDEIYDTASAAVITYSDVYTPTGVYSGTGNINADPLFVAPITATAAPTTAGNYRLLVGSPAIDAGNTLSVTVPTDLDGNPRVSGAAVDMGAYEYRATLSLTVTKQAYPDPVQAGAQLTYTIRMTNTGNIALNGILIDTLPAHVAPTGVLTWTLTNLAPNDVWLKTVVVTVDMGYSGTLVNQVQVTTLEGASGSASATVHAQVTPALQVTKQASADSVRGSAQLTYTLRVTNTGNLALNGVITDTLPANVAPTGVLTWLLANLTPGNAWMRTVIVTVPLGYSGTLTNRVQVTTAEGATGEAQVSVNAIGYRIYFPCASFVFLSKSEFPAHGSKPFE